jgi:hypothetical protein
MEPAKTLSRYRLTIEDFKKISKISIFKEDDRIELREGKMIKMESIGEKHMGVVLWLDRLFNTRLSRHKKTCIFAGLEILSDVIGW